MGEHSERLTSGTSGTTPYCPCKPFSCETCPGTRLATIGVGPSVSNQERRVAIVLLINRPSAAHRGSRFGLNKIQFPDMPCMKKVYKDK